MAQQSYRTANGKMVAMETLRLENEKTIAVGNMKVNARGDTLGPGGKPILSKQQATNEYYNLHTPTSNSNQIREQKFEALEADPILQEQDNAFDNIPETPQPEAPEFKPYSTPAAPGQKPIRGSIAAAVAQKPVDVKQELMKTAKQQIKAKGPQRF